MKKSAKIGGFTVVCLVSFSVKMREKLRLEKMSKIGAINSETSIFDCDLARTFFLFRMLIINLKQIVGMRGRLHGRPDEKEADVDCVERWVF